MGKAGFQQAAPAVQSDTEVISIQDGVPDHLYLVEGDIIRTRTSGTFQGTDNYGAPSITVEELIEP